jgi:hypothetical protein
MNCLSIFYRHVFCHYILYFIYLLFFFLVYFYDSVFHTSVCRHFYNSCTFLFYTVKILSNKGTNLVIVRFNNIFWTMKMFILKGSDLFSCVKAAQWLNPALIIVRFEGLPTTRLVRFKPCDDNIISCSSS